MPFMAGGHALYPELAGYFPPPPLALLGGEVDSDSTAASRGRDSAVVEKDVVHAYGFCLLLVLEREHFAP